MPPSFTSVRKTTRAILDETHFIKHHLKLAWYRADNDRRDGFPERNGEILGIVSSDISDLTSALALGPKDEIEQSQKAFMEHLHAAQRHIVAAKRQLLNLTGLDHETAQQIAEELARKTRDCENCGRTVAGNRDDRLIRGRCDTCYRYLDKHKKDRPIPYDPTSTSKKKFVPAERTTR